MICLLVFIQVFDILWHHVASPLQVEHVVLLAFDHDQPRVFTSIHYSIVDMRIIKNFERHIQILHFFSFVLSDAVALLFVFDVGWILEKSSWWSIFKN